MQSIQKRPPRGYLAALTTLYSPTQTERLRSQLSAAVRDGDKATAKRLTKLLLTGAQTSVSGGSADVERGS